MKQFTSVGRLLYGIGITALGIHQLIIRDFRTEIIPAFPAWMHQFVALPILAGIALIFAGIIISGLFKIKSISTRDVCLYTGFGFLICVVAFHLPYILVVNPETALQLQGWFGGGEALAYSGGAFVMAGSYSEGDLGTHTKNGFGLWLEKLIPLGRIFYSMLIILFGCSHFVYTEFVSTMVPGWCGSPLFWTYFFGVALIGSGVAIIFKIWIKPAALLQALMLFLFFLFFHVPDAIANPTVSGGTEIVRALIALVFCGISLVIAWSTEKK